MCESEGYTEDFEIHHLIGSSHLSASSARYWSSSSLSSSTFMSVKKSKLSNMFSDIYRLCTSLACWICYSELGKHCNVWQFWIICSVVLYSVEIPQLA